MATDSPGVEWQEQRALIIGRGYPEPSRKHIETVCTGAITEDGRLLRLYPVSWRYLEDHQQYRLWSWARFDISKSGDDKRKESYRVREQTIQVLSCIKSPEEQFSLLRPAIVPDQETLERRYHEDWTSLGIVEIEMVDFKAEMPRSDWAKSKPYTKQSRLDVEVKPLEQPPVQLKLAFRCKNNPACKVHHSGLIGWEYMETFRQFRGKYGSESDGVATLKEAMVKRFSNAATSAYALLGTHSRFPVWMIGQLYFFRKDLQPLMF
jgi:hypothetical protein